MKIGLIVGSQRHQNQSSKVANFAKELLKKIDAQIDFYELDLSKKVLPLWDEGVWERTESWKNIWDPISKELKSCDGFVVFSPEYAGMVPAAIKNFFLFAGKEEVGHKPGLIISVSSGRGGSYPISELRMSSYKNSRINWIPDHVIVRNVENVLNGPDSKSEEEQMMRSRTDYCLRVFLEYAKALSLVRKSGVLDYKNHPNGM